MVEVSADLTQVVYLEMDGDRRPLTPVPEGFSPRWKYEIGLGEAFSSDGREVGAPWLRDPKLRVNRAIPGEGGKILMEVLEGNGDGQGD